MLASPKVAFDTFERLHDSMIELGRCETQYGEPDWYDRVGYMYYEFLTDKYRPSGCFRSKPHKEISYETQHSRDSRDTCRRLRTG